MAAVTASNVTLISNDLIGSASGKVIATKRRFSIVLSTQGATAGDISDSLLGFASGRILSVFAYRFIKAGPAEANVNVTTNGSSIYTLTSVDGTTAPADVSGTLYIQVEGDSV